MERNSQLILKEFENRDEFIYWTDSVNLCTKRNPTKKQDYYECSQTNVNAKKITPRKTQKLKSTIKVKSQQLTALAT